MTEDQAVGALKALCIQLGLRVRVGGLSRRNYIVTNAGREIARLRPSQVPAFIEKLESKINESTKRS